MQGGAGETAAGWKARLHSAAGAPQKRQPRVARGPCKRAAAGPALTLCQQAEPAGEAAQLDARAQAQAGRQTEVPDIAWRPQAVWMGGGVRHGAKRVE